MMRPSPPVAVLIPALLTTLLLLASIRPASADPPSNDVAPTELAVDLRGANGDALPGAHVALHAWQPWKRRHDGSNPRHPAAPTPPVASQVTGAEGAANLGDPATGRYRLVVDAPGHARAEQVVTWVRGEASRRVDVRLEPGHVLDVAAITREDVPISGARIVLAQPRSGDGVAPATRTWRGRTDGAGRCRIDGLPDGLYEVWAFTARTGYRGGGVVRVPGIRRTRVLVRDADDIPGVVRDAGGRVVTHGTVHLTEWWAAPQDDTTASGPIRGDGTFVAVSTKSWGRFESATVVRPGAIATRLPLSRRRRSDTSPIVLTIPRGGALRGTVRVPDGPVAGATVEVLTSGLGPFGTYVADETTTDEHGVYAFHWAPAGPAVVLVRADGFTHDIGGAKIPFPSWLTPKKVARLPKHLIARIEVDRTATHDVRIDPREPVKRVDVQVRGVVLTPDGRPAPYKQVSGTYDREQGPTYSRADGSFTLTLRTSLGMVELVARDVGFASPGWTRTVSTSCGFEGVELRLAALPFVTGRITAGDDGQPDEVTFRVGQEILTKGGPQVGWSAPITIRTDVDGSFRLPVGERRLSGEDVLQGDELVVAAFANGHADALTAAFTWDQAEDGHDVGTLTLAPDVPTTGRLLGSDVAPIADAIIRVARPPSGRDAWPPRMPPLPSSVAWTTTADDGTFGIEGLSGFPCELRVSAPGHESSVRTVGPWAAPLEWKLEPASDK